MFRLATARRPDAEGPGGAERRRLQDFLAHYTKDAAAAKELIGIGETKPDPRLDPGELAAWTMIANVILNLDEVVTKG